MKRKSILLVLMSVAMVLLAAGCVKAASSRGWATPAQFQDLILVSTKTGKLDAINPSTGDRAWRFPDDWTISDKRAQKLQGIYGAPQVVGDTIYIGDYNGFVYAFKPSEASSDKGSRKAAAFVDVKGAVVGGVAVDSTGQNLYVTTSEGRLYAMKAAGFAPMFPSFDAGDRIWTPPVLSGANVYFATTDGVLFALNASSGKEVWRFKTDSALVSAPVVAGNTVLVGGFGRTLYAVDVETGKSRWQFQADDWIWSQPEVDGDRVYFGDFSGKVFAVSLSSGEPIWDKPFDAGHSIRSSPALSGGTLVVGADNGDVFGVNTATGEASWGPVVVGSTLQADLVATPSSASVFVAPSGCIGKDPERLYYYRINTSTHEPQGTSAVCQ